MLGLIIDPSTYLPLESGGIKNNPDAGCSGEAVGRREENNESDSENGGVSSRPSGRCKVELEPGGGKKQPPPPRAMSPISSRHDDRARRSHDGKVFLTQDAFVTQDSCDSGLFELGNLVVEVGPKADPTERSPEDDLLDFSCLSSFQEDSGRRFGEMRRNGGGGGDCVLPLPLPLPFPEALAVNFEKAAAPDGELSRRPMNRCRGWEVLGPKTFRLYPYAWMVGAGMS